MSTEFQRPTLLELIARVASDIEGSLVGVNARLRRTVEFVLARAIAGVAHGLHGHLAWIAEQIIVDQAVDRFVVRWADLYGLAKTPATAGHCTIQVTGTGGDLTEGTLFYRQADSFTFSVDADALDVTIASVEITAVDTGPLGNLQVGELLYLVSDIAGIDSPAIVTAAGVQGADEETTAHLLVRLLERIQRPPLGGAPGDYETWAKQISGVTRAWEFRGVDGMDNPGLGKVSVTFVYDDREDIIPNDAEVDAMQAYLDARAPSQVYVFAPTPVEFDYELTVVPPGNAAVQNAIIAEVAYMLSRDATPGGTPNGGMISLSRFNEAVSAAPGETSHITISPDDDVEYEFGEIAVPGTPTWTP